MQLCDKIRIIRKARQKSQETLAHDLSLSRQTISDWENNKFEPTLPNVRALCDALDVSFDTLLDDAIDLNDKQTFKAALNHVSSETKKKINNSHRYRVFKYAIKKTDYIKLAIYFLVLIFGIVMTIVGFLYASTNFGNILSEIGVAIVLLVASLAFIPVLLIRKIKRGGNRESFGTLSQTHFVMIERSDSNYDKSIYIPVSEIVGMKVEGGSEKKHGRVVVDIKGRTKPYVTADIVDPANLVREFENLRLDEEK